VLNPLKTRINYNFLKEYTTRRTYK